MELRRQGRKERKAGTSILRMSINFQIRITGAFSLLAASNRSFESLQDLLFGSFMRKEQMDYPILFSFPLPPPKEES